LIDRGWEAQGLSLRDYRDKSVSSKIVSPQFSSELEQFNDTQYVVGDANFLDETIAKHRLKPPYQLVTSTNLGIWLRRDPLAWLESAVNCVAAGGILAVDKLNFSNERQSRQERLPNPYTLTELWQSLQDAGFRLLNPDCAEPGQLSARINNQFLKDMVIVRDHDQTPVRFAANYVRSKVRDAALYTSI
jgi:hypothetical protein